MNEDDSSSSTTDVYQWDNKDDDSRYTTNSESDVYNDDLDITGPVLQVDTNTSNTDFDDANHAAIIFQVAIKQKKGPNSRRTTSLSYHLQYEDGTTYPVCKAMFCATFGIPIRTIGSW